ncbi:MAG: dockerin type I domain-containing protein [Desulfatirhabdiaceae bacterium]
MNNDGIVDLTDAVLALQVINGLQPTGIYLSADVNGDGKIGMAEVIYILQQVAYSGF